MKKPKWSRKYLGDAIRTASVQSAHRLTLKKETSNRAACVHWIILYRLMIHITMFIIEVRVFMAIAALHSGCAVQNFDLFNKDC